MVEYLTPPEFPPLMDLAPHIERAKQVTQAFAAVTAPEYEVEPISEYEFLHGTPHPVTHAHTAAVVDRVNALKPPSLVKLDRAEVALAAVVARRKLEQSGQFQTDQWWDLKRYEDGLVDRYIKETT